MRDPSPDESPVTASTPSGPHLPIVDVNHDDPNDWTAYCSACMWTSGSCTTEAAARAAFTDHTAPDDEDEGDGPTPESVGFKGYTSCPYEGRCTGTLAAECMAAGTCAHNALLAQMHPAPASTPSGERWRCVFEGASSPATTCSAADPFHGDTWGCGPAPVSGSGEPAGEWADPDQVAATLERLSATLPNINGTETAQLAIAADAVRAAGAMSCRSCRATNADCAVGIAHGRGGCCGQCSHGAPAASPNLPRSLTNEMPWKGPRPAPSPVPVDGERPGLWVDRVDLAHICDLIERDMRWDAIARIEDLAAATRPTPAPPVDEPGDRDPDGDLAHDVLGAIASWILQYPEGFKPGAVAYDAECPWEHNEVGWDDLASYIAQHIDPAPRPPVVGGERRPVDVTALPEWDALVEAVDGTPYLAGSGRIGLAAAALLAAADRRGEG